MLVLATHNKGKLRELRELLRGQVPGLDVDTQVVDAGAVGAPDVAETGVTFAENSLLKARAVAQATGLVAIADDSGLAVDVLGGAPGHLLGPLGRPARGRRRQPAAAAGPAGRRAGRVPRRRVCLRRGAGRARLPRPEQGREVVEYGQLEGTLLREPRGAGGFGYDPVLQPSGLDRSCAELSPEEKNAISHRGHAFRALLPAIVEALSGGSRPLRGAGTSLAAGGSPAPCRAPGLLRAPIRGAFLER